MTSEAPRCAACHTDVQVRLVGGTLSASSTGTDLYGCRAHARGLALAVDDVLDDLEWLQRTRADRVGRRDSI